MPTFHFPCPFCKTKLETEQEWRGMQLTCPTCGRELQIPSDPALPADNPPDAPARNARRYRFGRFYIMLSPAIAVLFILLGVWAIANSVHTYLEQVSRPTSAATVAALQKRQADLLVEYSRVANLLSDRSRDPNGNFQGLNLPAGAFQWKQLFNEQLSTRTQIRESLAAVAEARQKISDLQNRVRDFLLRNLAALAAQLPGSATIPTSANTAKTTAAIRLKTGEIPPIYTVDAETQMRKHNERLRQVLSALQQNNSSAEAVHQLRIWAMFLSFLEQNMFSSERTGGEVGGLNSNLNFPANNVAHDQDTEIKINGFQYLTLYSKLISGDTQKENTWRISHSADLLEQELNELDRKLELFEVECSAARRILFTDIIKNGLVALLAAFAVLIIADILRAHFDIADQTRREP